MTRWNVHFLAARVITRPEASLLLRMTKVQHTTCKNDRPCAWRNVG